MLTYERLIELLDYDPATGKFYRKITTSSQAIIGDEAGTITNGYIFISLDNERYRAHDLVWLYHYKKWPQNILDHRDLNGTHNTLSNLRETDKSGNGANRKLSLKNSTGFKGVSRRKDKYHAGIRVHYRQKFLGSFSDPIDAAKAYDDAAVQYFGEFALTNKQLGLIP